jgi:hypothetical protein
VLGRTISFRRASNPHAGCWFLTQAQMKRFAAAAHFMDKQSTFIGPLGKRATLVAVTELCDLQAGAGLRRLP